MTDDYEDYYEQHPEERAYLEGESAYHDDQDDWDKTQTTNPYAEGTPEHIEWDQGYIDAGLGD